MSEMNDVAAIQVLQVFNEWRRGDRDDCDDPKTIGLAIDWAIKRLDDHIDTHVKDALKRAKGK